MIKEDDVFNNSEGAFFDPSWCSCSESHSLYRFLLFFSVNGFPYNLQKREKKKKKKRTHIDPHTQDGSSQLAPAKVRSGWNVHYIAGSPLKYSPHYKQYKLVSYVTSTAPYLILYVTCTNSLKDGLASLIMVTRSIIHRDEDLIEYNGANVMSGNTLFIRRKVYL